VSSYSFASSMSNCGCRNATVGESKPLRRKLALRAELAENTKLAKKSLWQKDNSLHPVILSGQNCVNRVNSCEFLLKSVQMSPIWVYSCQFVPTFSFCIFHCGFAFCTLTFTLPFPLPVHEPNTANHFTPSSTHQRIYSFSPPPLWLIFFIIY
jgi:hypothetical protein